MGVLLGVFVGVIVDVGVGVMVCRAAISTSKITYVGVCVDIGDATAVWVEVKNGVISPSEAQPVKMMLEMINKDSIPILINPNITHLVII